MTNQILQPIPPAPPFIGNDIVAISGGQATVFTTAGQVLIYAFELAVPVTITGCRWRMGATTTGHTNMGIYTFAGNLVPGSDTGTILNVASTTQTQTYGAAITLAPGRYFVAISCDNITDTYVGSSLPGAAADDQLTRIRLAANTVSAGALPATLGALNNTIKAIACGLVVSGGLP